MLLVAGFFMRLKNKFVVIIAIVAALEILFLDLSFSQSRKKVFIVQSYAPEFVWSQKIDEGIHEALRDVDVMYQYAYLDAKRKSTPQELRQAAKETLLKIEAFAPDVVIAIDDAAQSYLVEPYLKGRANPQVIFCGVNAPLSTYGYPASNVSGVREQWHWRDSFLFLKRMVPQAQTVAVLMDDSKTSGYILDALFEDQRQNGPFALEIVGVEKSQTFKEWKEKLLAQQRKADVLALGLYHSLKDAKTGQSIAPEQVSGWNNSVVEKPTIGFLDFALEDGLLAGILESGNEQGYLAGAMAKEALEKHVAAGSLPVRINLKGIVFINLKEAERLGIPIQYELYEAAGVVVR